MLHLCWYKLGHMTVRNRMRIGNKLVLSREKLCYTRLLTKTFWKASERLIICFLLLDLEQVLKGIRKNTWKNRKSDTHTYWLKQMKKHAKRVGHMLTILIETIQRDLACCWCWSKCWRINFNLPPFVKTGVMLIVMLQWQNAVVTPLWLLKLMLLLLLLKTCKTQMLTYKKYQRTRKNNIVKKSELQMSQTVWTILILDNEM